MLFMQVATKEMWDHLKNYAKLGSHLARIHQELERFSQRWSAIDYVACFVNTETNLHFQQWLSKSATFSASVDHGTTYATGSY